MFKKGFKIIVIKDGQFELREYNVKPYHIPFLFGIIFTPFIIFYFLMSTYYNFSENNLDDLILQQSSKIENLELRNKIQSEKITNYESTIEKNINENKTSLKNLNSKLKENQKRSDKIVKVLFNTEGLSKEIRKVGSGGQDSISLDKPFESSNLNKLYDETRFLTTKINKLQKQIKLEELYIEKIEKRFNSNISYWNSIPSRMPLNIKRGIYISSYYGYRDDPMDGKKRFHAGDDYSANRDKVKDWIGTPVRATANGVVSKLKYDNRFGNYIEIDHGYGFKTVYAHLNNFSVKKGDKVYRGQEIGGVGNTGRSTAAHLHYEVKKNNKTIDPRQYYMYNYKLKDLVYNK